MPRSRGDRRPAAGSRDLLVFVHDDVWIDDFFIGDRVIEGLRWSRKLSPANFVIDRLLARYRERINPQARLPYLATYLGRKVINSTLVYLTVTQELRQQVSERFRRFTAHTLHAAK